ncbi:MAG: hypothetical protein IJR77_02700 [Bacteroidales bacterium]|nr:hypothetical protein [Bacteroidales bacterium]
MKRFYSIAAALMTALAVTAASDSFAQTRATGATSRTGSSQTTRSSSSTTTRSSSSSTKQSGTTTRSSGSTSTSRQSGTSTRSTSGTSTRQSGTTTRSTSGTTTRQSGTTTRQSGSTTRSTSGTTTTRQSGTTTRATGSTSTTATTRATQSGTAVRSTGSTETAASTSTVRVNSNITRSGLGNTQSQAAAPKESYRDNGGNYRYGDDNFRMDRDRNLARTAPRHRDFLGYDRPGHFWGDVPHYYGYRINYLPPRYRRVNHWGIDYYIYNNIYYRYYGGVYYVSRPPFGVRVAMAIDRAFLNAVRFSYYTNAYRAFNYRFDYYDTIAEQNRLIAQQNALIAQQNANYALNSSRALTAYELANKLNLVQSYAYANSDYFYQDGVFYLYQNGQYTTIIPPAGALVTSLPDDYETIVMNGVEYYMVDNTVYRTMLFDSQPYLEVLGQMYGSMYDKYNYYR